MKLSRTVQPTLVAALASILAAFLILDRWIVTDLGVKSFGRVWPFYVNYGDFGFVRRGLVGTLLQATPFPGLFENAYHFAITVQHLALLALIGLTTVYFLRSKYDQGWLFKAAVFLSPAFILQVAYTTGSLDVFILILAFLNIVLVRNVFLFSAVMFVGPFVHELFLFTAPAQFTAYLLRNDLQLLAQPGRSLRMLAPPVLALSVSALIVILFGVTSMPQAQYEAAMARLIPHAVGQMDLWSGYFEVGSSIEQNQRSLGFLAMHLLRHAGFLIVPVGYAAFVFALLVRNEPRWFQRLLLAASAAAPFLIYVIATDFYRWVGLSASMSLLLLMAYGAQKPLQLGKGPLIALLLFSLCAPFGGPVIQNPLPMHQFILKKLGVTPPVSPAIN